MKVTLTMVDDDLADLEVWYANKLAAVSDGESVKHQPLTVTTKELGEGD